VASAKGATEQNRTEQNGYIPPANVLRADHMLPCINFLLAILCHREITQFELFLAYLLLFIAPPYIPDLQPGSQLLVRLERELHGFWSPGLFSIGGRIQFGYHMSC
jgi:hypothetical protein